jgi:hypothetical protein
MALARSGFKRLAKFAKSPGFHLQSYQQQPGLSPKSHRFFNTFFKYTLLLQHSGFPVGRIQPPIPNLGKNKLQPVQNNPIIKQLTTYAQKSAVRINIPFYGHNTGLFSG